MNPRQQDMMIHALAGDTGNPYRNHYCVAVGTDTHREWLELLDRGLADAGRTINDGRDMYFYVTELGMATLRAQGI